VTIVPGESQAYSVTGEDTYGNVIGTITTAKFAISQPGDISWTAGAYNVANPAAPVASSDVEYSWLCQLSTNPCPPARGHQHARWHLTQLRSRPGPDRYLYHHALRRSGH
jgi:hypothetical protein